MMNKIEIAENVYFDFLPHKRLGWYILILIDIISLFALILTGEFYLWLLIGLLTLAIVPTSIKLIKTIKQKPDTLTITVSTNDIIFKFQEKEAKIDKNIIKALIMQPDTSEGKHKMLINLVCKCDKKDKVLLTKLPQNLFYGQRLRDIEHFLHTHLPSIELIFFDTSEI